MSPRSAEFLAAARRRLFKELAAAARNLQPAREQADYDAWEVPADEARRVIELATAFVAAVDDMVE